MTVKNRQGKIRFSLMLALAAMMVVFMAPNMFAYADGEDNWAGLQEKINAGGTIKLEQDYTAGENDTALVVPEDKEVILDLNGYTIDRGLTSSDGDDRVMTVNGNLTIKDSGKGDGKITGGWTKGDGGAILVNGNLDLKGGTISGNHADNIGGGICLGNEDENKTSTITMSGGTISNNGSGISGGGVAVREGTFTMSGGTISNNETAEEHGGGVFLIGDIAKFIMKDGASISGNKADGNGGGVFVLVGSIDMSGGIISDNTAEEGDGGGVYIMYGYSVLDIESQSFNMSGGTITGNEADQSGGGVFANVNMTMSGGTISKNTAGEDGGGAFVDEHCNFVLSGGIITENSVDTFNGGGGGVCVTESSIEMSGGTISKNTAVDGGGVYLLNSAFGMTDGAITENEAEMGGGGVNANLNGEFTMSGGSISDNTAKEEAGGVLVAGSTFTMEKGVVSGNECDGDGGGVYVRQGKLSGITSESTFNLLGGSINDNKLTDSDADDEHGGGVAVLSSTFNLSGKPVVKDNSGTKGQTENVYLGNDQPISITNALESDADIGVSMRAGQGTFTTGYMAKMAGADPAAYFTSDDVDYSVLKDDNGEAKIGKIEVKKVDIEIAPPVCGDTIEIEGLKYPAGAQPQVTIPEDAHYSVALMDDGKTLNAYWGTITEGSYETLDDDTKLQGGQTYKALVYIKADPGYKFAGDAKVTVNGEDDLLFSHTADHQLRVFWDLIAIHDLSKTEAKKATCTEDGNIEYWTCGGCEKFFEDRDGRTEIADAKTIVIDATGHRHIVKVAAKEATDTEDGNIEHWTCTDCGMKFSDEQGTTELSEKDVVIPKKGVSIRNAKIVLSASAFTYNGKVRKPAIKTIAGKALKSGTDYTVKWSNKSPKDVGQYTITITGKGVYKGTAKATYRINPKGTSIKKPKKAKKAITVKWKKQQAKMSKSRITGYQIQLATDRKFTKNVKKVKVKGYKKTSRKVKKLKARTKYFVKVRTYKTIGKTTYYSGWSKVKTVKTK